MSSLVHSGQEAVVPTDLFGNAAAPVDLAVERKTTLFGEGLDRLAQERGGWPSAAMVFAVEVLGQGENPSILLTGGVPIGVRRDGSPRFGPRKDDLKTAALLSEYRAAIAKATGEASA